MFGHKNAGLLETERRTSTYDDAAKLTQARRKAVNWMKKDSIESRARKEMYFAVASTFRWSQ